MFEYPSAASIKNILIEKHLYIAKYIQRYDSLLFTEIDVLPSNELKEEMPVSYDEWEHEFTSFLIQYSSYCGGGAGSASNSDGFNSYIHYFRVLKMILQRNNLLHPNFIRRFDVLLLIELGLWTRQTVGIWDQGSYHYSYDSWRGEFDKVLLDHLRHTQNSTFRWWMQVRYDSLRNKVYHEDGFSDHSHHGLKVREGIQVRTGNQLIIMVTDLCVLLIWLLYHETTAMVLLGSIWVLRAILMVGVIKSMRLFYDEGVEVKILNSHVSAICSNLMLDLSMKLLLGSPFLMNRPPSEMVIMVVFISINWLVMIFMYTSLKIICNSRLSGHVSISLLILCLLIIFATPVHGSSDNSSDDHHQSDVYDDTMIVMSVVFCSLLVTNAIIREVTIKRGPHRESDNFVLIEDGIFFHYRIAEAKIRGNILGYTHIPLMLGSIVSGYWWNKWIFVMSMGLFIAGLINIQLIMLFHNSSEGTPILRGLAHEWKIYR